MASKTSSRKRDVVQVKNPRSGRYVKIDRGVGRIVSHKKSSGPYKGVPVAKARQMVVEGLSEAPVVSDLHGKTGVPVVQARRVMVVGGPHGEKGVPLAGARRVVEVLGEAPVVGGLHGKKSR